MLAAKLRVHPMAIVNYDTLIQDFLKLVNQGRMTREDAVRTAEDVTEYIKAEAKNLNPVECLSLIHI